MRCRTPEGRTPTGSIRPAVRTGSARGVAEVPGPVPQWLVPTARARRDVREHVVEAHALVPGDLVLLEAGDRVPADGRLTVAQSAETAEAALPALPRRRHEAHRSPPWAAPCLRPTDGGGIPPRRSSRGRSVLRGRRRRSAPPRRGSCRPAW
ncbi:hypothetical protein [Streptomyces griseoruber]|uniref:P-type ATPase n=1 Tax=Streptomyces griseoruber TaxID=1943 RepID=UPI0019817318